MEEPRLDVLLRKKINSATAAIITIPAATPTPIPAATPALTPDEDFVEVEGESPTVASVAVALADVGADADVDSDSASVVVFAAVAYVGVPDSVLGRYCIVASSDGAGAGYISLDGLSHSTL